MSIWLMHAKPISLLFVIENTQDLLQFENDGSFSKSRLQCKIKDNYIYLNLFLRCVCIRG